MVIKLVDAAPRWARHYCEFSGATPDQIERIIREKKGLKDVCGKLVSDAYSAYL